VSKSEWTKETAFSKSNDQQIVYEYYDTDGLPVARVDSPGPDEEHRRWMESEERKRWMEEHADE
jgi:hypothetical protein